MNKKQLDAYRETLKKRTFVCILFGVGAAALSILDYYKSFGHDRVESIAPYFKGALITIGLVALCIILGYVKAFDAEGTLKRLYKEEHSPRNQLAKSKSGFPMILYTSAAMAVAAIVAAYINHTVFFALMIAAIVQLAAAVAVRYIYMNILPDDAGSADDDEPDSDE